MRKIFYIFSLISVICCLFITNVSAKRYRVIFEKEVGGITYKQIEGKDGVYVARGKNPYEGEIVIPDKVTIDGTEYRVLGSTDSAFLRSPFLKKVDIRYNIDCVDNFQFYGCLNLESVKFASDLLHIGYSAFSNCYQLTGINLNRGIKFIDDSAFEYCYNLKDINFPESIERIGKYAFGHCFSLENVVIPCLVKQIEKECFSHCVNLKKVEFKGEIEEIGEKAFWACHVLDNVNFPNTLKVIQNKAFQGCQLFTHVVFPSSLNFLGWDSFALCDQIKNISFEGKKPPKALQTLFVYDWRSDPGVVNVNVPDGSERAYRSRLRSRIKGTQFKVCGFKVSKQELSDLS